MAVALVRKSAHNAYQLRLPAILWLKMEAGQRGRMGAEKREYHKLTRKVSRYVSENKTAVYGLENAYGYGRSLAVWLLEKGCTVKDVNTALSYAQRKSVPMYQKSDSYDAEAVALVLINMLDRLPDAVPDDKYWTLSQL